MMKNAFHFTLKALFILKIFRISSWLIGHVEHIAWLEQRNTIYILPNISKSKDNETMRFGQLIKYYMRNIFSKIKQKMKQED